MPKNEDHGPYQDAGTGKFVDKPYADKHPDSTIGHRPPSAPKSPSGGKKK